ncbi:probable Probable cysteine protease ATG4 [Nakaseomyces glabratus]|nr:probable Probable cysteine protease ATG4 [Nakaseomyces glabratus]SLM10227.1 probable Probable cysteine protease ATG4 [Nakaseomyces glabratus]
METIHNISNRLQEVLVTNKSVNVDTDNDSLSSNQEDNEVEKVRHLVVILGEKYSYAVDRNTGINTLMQWFTTNSEIPEEILNAIRSKLNFTYRTNFEPIERAPDGPSPINPLIMLRINPMDAIENIFNNRECFFTDVGWGCMIRTGQSLLGNALQRVKSTVKDQPYIYEMDDTKEITDLFKDNTKSAFSLQNFVKCGRIYNKIAPGEWFGPATTATCIRYLIQENPCYGIEACYISVSSGDIFKENIQALIDDFDESCHTENFGKLNFSDLDPSMLLGFLLPCSKWDEFQEFTSLLTIVNVLDGMDQYRDPDLNSNDIGNVELSPQLKLSQTPDAITDDDYVDIGALIQGNSMNINDRDNGYQEVQCKNQQIVIMDSLNETKPLEIEKVLVGQGTNLVNATTPCREAFPK